MGQHGIQSDSLRRNPRQHVVGNETSSFEFPRNFLWDLVAVGRLIHRYRHSPASVSSNFVAPFGVEDHQAAPDPNLGLILKHELAA